MTDIPATVRLAPHTIVVTADTAAAHTLSQAAGEQLYGNWDARYLTITLDPSQADSQVAETLLHELLHACADAAGLDEDDEERTVNAIAPRLLSVLRDNPQLVRFLAGG